MMGASEIRSQSRGGILTITIDRPAKRNAITAEMCEALHDAWRSFAASDTDRVAILTAAGDDVFSAGADLNAPPPKFWRAVPNLGVPLDKPVIAATSGLVIGAGVVLVTMSDLCIASDSTKFIYPEAKVGVALGVVSALAARIPHKVAMELALTGAPIDAQRAYDVGFVNRVVPVGRQLAAATEMAEMLAENAPLVIGMLKSAMLRTLPKSPVELRYEMERAVDGVLESEDAKEGPRAFLEKRKPRFTGR
jgi:enoyl-CoA hydratase/carnithine racemase